MDKITQLLERHGYGKEHPDYEQLAELIRTVMELKETVDPFISNDPVTHRVNIILGGKKYLFMARQDDEYYLRMAAKIINQRCV